MSPYLDHASTTPMHPAAAEAMAGAAAEHWADPSRLYGDARRARIALDAARATVAGAIGARADEMVFTASGTESCNLAVMGGARAARAARKPPRVVVCAIEHTAVLEAARALQPEGFEVVEIGVDRMGVADLDALERACAGGAALVSLQTANPEIGTMQPVAAAAAIASAAGALMHTDACMTVGHVPTDVGALGVDLLSASAHKCYGPAGAGALWVRRGVRVRPLSVGDDRERGRRAGAENLPAIAGFAAALDARARELDDEAPRLRALTTLLREGAPAATEGVLVYGHPHERLPGLVALGVQGLDGEAMLLGFDRREIAVHSGSSCTASPTEPSHVLAAIGAPGTGSLRISLGRESTEQNVRAFLDALGEVAAEVRRVAG